MKRRKLSRLWKRVLILFLCTTLVSGAYFHKHRIAAHATAVVGTFGAYTLYEICMYVGTLIATGLGVGYVYENRDDFARLGKKFIDTCNLDELSGWVLSKVNTTGQSYVFGTEALQEVQTSSWEVIEGGGGSPENNDDNDDDGDKDADDRTVELKNLGMWATATFSNFICNQLQPFLEEIASGEISEENPIAQTLDLSSLNTDLYYSSDYGPDASGLYHVNGVSTMAKYTRLGYSGEATFTYELSTSKFPCVIFSGSSAEIYSYNAEKDSFNYLSVKRSSYKRTGVLIETVNTFVVEMDNVNDCSFNCPVFLSKDAARAFFLSGDQSGIVNMPKVYQIADWLQEDWRGAIEALNTGIRSLNDIITVVGQLANQALNNQMNGLGYIELLKSLLAGIAAMSLPETIADPVYYPEPSTSPGLDPSELPWTPVNPVPEPEPKPDPDPGLNPDDDFNMSNYKVDLRQIFPFCIPFDFIALLDVLDADPEAPKFDIPFVSPSLGIEETYVIDLSFFDEQMALLRKLELVGFVIGLMFLTSKVIKW